MKLLLLSLRPEGEAHDVPTFIPGFLTFLLEAVLSPGARTGEASSLGMHPPPVRTHMYFWVPLWAISAWHKDSLTQVR